jgi:hypothetical protein
MKKWINKQIWRVAQTHRLFSPFFDIVKLIFWGIMTVGITQWFIITINMAVGIIFCVFSLLLITGYILDKTGFLQESGSRAFKISHTELYMHQLDITAAKTSIPILCGFVHILFMLRPELSDTHNIADMKEIITANSRETIKTEKQWFEAQKSRGEMNHE